MRSILYILFAVGGVLVAIALSMVLLDDEGDQQVQPQSPSIELSQPAADKAETSDKDSGTSLQPPNVTPAAPLTIDLARVKPDGAAVFAGTAAPNAKIRIFEGDILLGETIANANGEWVIVLEKSLAAGQHLISVAMERSDGTTEMADRSLAVEIYQDTETKPLVALLPETATEVPVLDTETKPLVALLPETATEVPVLIQSPDDVDKTKSAATASEATASGTIVADAADAAPAKPQAKSQIAASQIAALAPSAIVWRDASRILISGTSRGGVRVAVNDAKGQFGEALVLADGAWQVAGSLDMDIAVNQLRFALFDDANQIIARYDLPVSNGQ